MKIVVIDDQEAIRYSLMKILTREGYDTLDFAGDEEDIVESVRKFKPTLVVMDVMLEDGLSGIDLARRFQEAKINTPIIMITAYTTPSNVIEAARAGVKDILQKPFEPSEFLEAVKRYAKVKKSASSNVIFFEEEGSSFVGSFDTMKYVYKKIGIAAGNDVAVLIRGETGSGKELIAKMIHKSSDRRDKPLVSLNCAAIPSELFESQLFGHERGSFTGADKQHIGFVEQAEDGTLFLDEIGELGILLQSKLLRFLETRKFRRIGGTREFEFKGRIVSATNIDVARHIQEGLFREDLFYRLSMITIDVPPLRERLGDIPALCSHFIAKANKELKTEISGISKEALTLLASHSWSGNVREFRNVVFNAALEADGRIIGDKEIQLVRTAPKEGTPFSDAIVQILDKQGVKEGFQIMETIEREFLKLFMQRVPNFSQASQYLQMSRNTLKAKLRKYGLYENSKDEEG